MQEAKNIYCGGLTPSGGNYITLDVKGETQNIELKVETISKATIGNIDDRSMDLLEIAAYVYCADSKISRSSPKLTDHGLAWQRNLMFHIPVRDIDFWKQNEVLQALSDVLNFMSGERFDFHFYKSLNPVIQIEQYFEFDDDPLQPDNVVLYSGGLDSFAGVLEQIDNGNKKLALVSHHSANTSKKGQEELLNQLKLKTGDCQLQHIAVRVVNKGGKITEYTQRTRSFLFASLAALVAKLYKKKEFYFYENGVISFNVALSMDIQGSRATRTTHPRVIAGFKALFQHVFNDEIGIHHPYLWLTKTDVARKLVTYKAEDLVKYTRSCTRTRITKNKHCGVCSQCIDRRFAILAAGLEDHESADLYDIDLLIGHRKDKEINLAVHFVKFALEIRNKTKAEFLEKYPIIYDSVRYLEFEAEDAVDKIYELFVRHADAVLGVMNKAVKESYSKSLSPNCLVRLYFSESSDRIGYVDSDGRDIYLEAISKIDHQSVYFWVGENEVKLTGGIKITGANYELFKFLLPNYKDGCYQTSHEIADKLKIDEPTVRKRINRFRKAVDGQVKLDLGFLGNIIQNKSREGYRVNPNLIKVEYESELRVIDQLSQK